MTNIPIGRKLTWSEQQEEVKEDVLEVVEYENGRELVAEKSIRCSAKKVGE